MPLVPRLNPWLGNSSLFPVMPFDPILLYGALPTYDRQEFRETGFLTDTVSFTPESEIKKKKGNTATALNQTLQVQAIAGDLKIEIKGSIVPDAQGRVHGLPAGYVGVSVTTCAHFAADGDSSIARHGYSRDADKLLLLDSAKTELGGDAPSSTLGMIYFRHVGKDAVALTA